MPLFFGLTSLRYMGVGFVRVLFFEVREGDEVRETLTSWVRGEREPKRS
jgi:hypothetical protein